MFSFSIRCATASDAILLLLTAPAASAASSHSLGISHSFSQMKSSKTKWNICFVRFDLEIVEGMFFVTFGPLSACCILIFFVDSFALRNELPFWEIKMRIVCACSRANANAVSYQYTQINENYFCQMHANECRFIFHRTPRKEGTF